MLSITDLKIGKVIKLNNDPYVVIRAAFQKTAQRTGVMKTEIRNILTGNVIPRTFQGSEKIEEADVARSRVQYLYKEGDKFMFMDNSSYEQFEMSKDQIGNLSKFMLDGSEVSVVRFEESPIAIELPPNLIFTVVECEPGVKGNTAQGGTKSATIETGENIQVPLFIKKDNKIKVDTRSGEYLERA